MVHQPRSDKQLACANRAAVGDGNLEHRSVAVCRHDLALAELAAITRNFGMTGGNEIRGGTTVAGQEIMDPG
ncbi:hypothetical protein NJB18091_13710 [Mycobacterium marinum]|nr:hypothetical protein NJB1507_32050 [Mycobacterium marinum]GJP28623.1 hypothetical protein NJB18091_13710 [Mycobacterium marinum]